MSGKFLTLFFGYRSRLTNYTDILFKSWTDSLKIFLPNNLKNFTLLSLNAYKKLWSSLFKSKVIYILTLILILSLYLSWQLRYRNSDLFVLLAPYLFVYCYIRGARASIENKDWYYFKSKFFRYNLIYLFFLIITGFLSRLVLSNAFHVNREFNYSIFQLLLKQLPSYIVSFLLFQLFICLMLFVFDSEEIYNLHKVLKSALKLFWYNLPFFLAAIIVFSLILISSFFILFFLSYLTKITGLQYLLKSYFQIDWKDFAIIGGLILTLVWLAICFFLLIPIYICWITNFYIKRLHEQFSLYYKT